MNLIIDTNSLASRGYYVSPYTFFNMVLSLIEDYTPDAVYYAFDSPNLFRRDYYPEYKGTRKPDAGRKEYIEQVRKALSLAGCNVVEIDGYEADDILGSCSGVYDTVVSGDKDLLQLIGRTNVLIIGRTFQDRKRWTYYDVYTKFGIYSGQLVDYKALAGEKSDNIPGVHLIGPKTAVKLLNKFASLDGIFDNLDKIKPLEKKRLLAGRERAYLSRDLATIYTDHIDLPANKSVPPDNGDDLRKAIPHLSKILKDTNGN